MPEIILEPVNKYGVRLFVGGCVERGDGSSFRRKGHAHVEEVDPYKGWICIRSWWRVLTGQSGLGKPSGLIWHEVAHCLVAPSNWHNKTWDRKRLELVRENRSNSVFNWHLLQKIARHGPVEARSQGEPISMMGVV